MSRTLQIATASLQIGMHVVELDRPWLETPFLTQGFVIKSDREIRRLQEYCRFVYILPEYKPGRTAAGPEFAEPRQTKKELFGDRAFTIYRDQAVWAQELPQAKVAIEQLSENIGVIFQNLARSGELEMLKIKSAVEPMIDSVTRNPDACLWLARMKQVDNYTYQHALGTSIWAVALGRQLGLPKTDLRSLAIGGMMMDVGKIQVDIGLLNAERRLSPEEFAEVKEHVRHGIEAFGGKGFLNEEIMDMVAYHHERVDGSGYPQGLKGNKIPIYGRIAAIVDTYDAITSHRSYSRGIPPAQAVKHLYAQRGKDFQAELVEEFIQAIGIYPAGTLVELSSGEIAIIVAEYRTRRLRPRVMVLLDAQQRAIEEPFVVDLLETTHTESGDELFIVNSLEPDAYGIDMRGLTL